MNKTYISPEITVIRTAPLMLLNGSPNKSDTDYQAGKPVLSPRHQGAWDEDEEYDEEEYEL